MLAAVEVVAVAALAAALVATGPAFAQTATDSPHCRLFTPDEVARHVGVPLEPGRSAIMQTACQWTSRDGGHGAMLRIMPARDHVTPKGGSRHKALPALGRGAHVSPLQDGWQAAAVAGDASITISLRGSTASEAAAVAMLQEAIARSRH